MACTYFTAMAQEPKVHTYERSNNPENPKSGDRLRYAFSVSDGGADVIAYRVTYTLPNFLVLSFIDRYWGTHNPGTRTITASGIRRGQPSMGDFRFIAIAAGTGEFRIAGTVITTRGTFNIDSRLPITVAPGLTIISPAQWYLRTQGPYIDITGDIYRNGSPINPETPRITDVLEYYAITGGGGKGNVTGWQVTYTLSDSLSLKHVEHGGSTHNPGTRTITASGIRVDSNNITIGVFQFVALAAGMGSIRITGTITTTQGTFNVDSRLSVKIASGPAAPVPPKPAQPVEPAPSPDPDPLPEPAEPVKPTPLPEPSVPTTGTWLAMNKPPSLSADNFTIRPGKFVILVHNGQQTAVAQADFKTYDSYYAFNAKTNDFPNLAKFFKNGGRIELVSHATLNPLPSNTRTPKFGDLIISEIMWGLNGSAQREQYIELYNASARTYTFTDGDLSFRFSTAADAPLPDEVFPLPANPNVEVKVIDRVSNKGWKVPGQGGNISQNKPLVSMYRTIDYTTGDTPDGTLASSWQASTGRVNLPVPNYGTPGTKHLPPAPIVHVDAAHRPPLYWIDTATGTLHRLVGDEVENLAPNVKNATSLAVDMAGGKLYWTEKTDERTGRIKRANLDGTNVKPVKNLTSVPYGIALDTVNGKLYLTNAWGKIQRLNIDGSNFQPNLITDLDTPTNLALDVTGGKVYWTEMMEEAGRIRRSHLDGSSVQKYRHGFVAFSESRCCQRQNLLDRRNNRKRRKTTPRKSRRYKQRTARNVAIRADRHRC